MGGGDPTKFGYTIFETALATKGTKNTKGDKGWGDFAQAEAWREEGGKTEGRGGCSRAEARPSRRKAKRVAGQVLARNWTRERMRSW